MSQSSMSLLYLVCTFGSAAVCVMLAKRATRADHLRAAYLALGVITATLGVLKLLPTALSITYSLMVALVAAVTAVWGMRVIFRSTRKGDSHQV